MFSRSYSTKNGFTLIELLVAMVVLIILLAVSIPAFLTYLQKENLLYSCNGVMDILSRAQSLAYSKKTYVGICFKQDLSNGQYYLQLYIPQLSSAQIPTNNDCDASDTLNYRYNLKSNVGICPNCDANIALNKSVFINKYGKSTLQNGTPTDFQICLLNSKLATGTRAREVELSSLGVVRLNKLGDAGMFSSVAANSGNCQ